MDKVVKFDSSIIKQLEKFKSKTRDHINSVVYKKDINEIQVTNGKAAIKIEGISFDVESGLYKITILSKDKILLEGSDNNYPIFNRIFPPESDIDNTQTLILSNKKEVKDESISMLINQLHNTVNFRYLLDFPVCNYQVFERKDFEHGGLKKGTPILFKSDADSFFNISIVIMPIMEVR